jgi:hypothetical protein
MIMTYIYPPSSNARPSRLQLHAPTTIDEICTDLGLWDTYYTQLQAGERTAQPTEQQVHKAVEAAYCKYLHPISGGPGGGWMLYAWWLNWGRGGGWMVNGI